MMRWIVGASLKFRYLVVAASVALLVVGVATLRDTPVDVFPEFSQPKIEVQTVTIGLSAEETEELVTVPIEQSLIGLPGLDTIRSKSVPQLSDVVMLFDRGTDLLRARQLVQERVSAVTPTLPTWAAPPVMLQPLSSPSRVLENGFPKPLHDLDGRLFKADPKIPCQCNAPGRIRAFRDEALAFVDQHSAALSKEPS